MVFDLFNTLTAPVDDVKFRASVTAMGLAAGVDPDGFTRSWFDLWRERFDGTFGTTDSGVRGVCEAIGAEVSDAASHRDGRWTHRVEFSQRTLQPREDAVMARCAGCTRSGLRTALISNCSADVAELWPTTPYAELIDEPLFSCVEGLVKPDSDLYLTGMCSRLGVGPAACVYVGDGGRSRIDGSGEGWDARGTDQERRRSGRRSYDSEQDRLGGARR